jgi:hypothetical protein
MNETLVRDTKEDWVSWYQNAEQLQEEDFHKVIWHITINLRATVTQISDMLRKAKQA